MTTAAMAMIRLLGALEEAIERKEPKQIIVLLLRAALSSYDVAKRSVFGEIYCDSPVVQYQIVHRKLFFLIQALTYAYITHGKRCNRLPRRKKKKGVTEIHFRSHPLIHVK